MAREYALDILSTSEGRELLSLKIGGVIKNLQKSMLWYKYRNTNIIGDPNAGTVEFKRLSNQVSLEYIPGNGNASNAMPIVANPIQLNMHIHRSLISRVEGSDVLYYGVEGLIDRQMENNQRTMNRDFERNFWGAGLSYTSRTEYDADADIVDVIDEAINAIESTRNQWVDGVERDELGLILTPALYTSLQKHIDKLPGIGGKQYDKFHGVEVDTSIYLPNSAKFCVIHKGAIGQLFRVFPDDAGKFPATNTYHFGLIYDLGAVAVEPELIKFGIPVSHFTIDGTSYKFEPGMTWINWVSSNYYNTDRFNLNGNTVVDSSNHQVKLANGSIVNANAPIIANGQYVTNL